jgi:hypothetical protein
VDLSKRHGLKLRRLVDLQREAMQLYDDLKGVAEAQTDALPTPDYALFEQQFGLPAGKGALVYNLLVGARAACRSAAVSQMLDWLG